MNKKTFLSTGGLGDSFIAASKLCERQIAFAKWVHVESVNLNPSFSNMIKFLRESLRDTECVFLHDEGYMYKYNQGHWREAQPISSGVDAWCPLKGRCEWKLEDPFAITRHCRKPPEYEMYDVCIQVAAGINNNRLWRVSPLLIAKLLRQKGNKVCLVGTCKLYEDAQDVDNFVNKLTLDETFSKIIFSKRFIGLAGVLSMFSVANKIPTIHYQIDEHHNKRYIHPLCSEYVINIKYGSMSELCRSLSL